MTETTDLPAAEEQAAPESCPRCMKPAALCVCAEIAPVATRKRVLILQHPREPDKLLGSARIANLALSSSVLKVGLSWPNLAKALGEPAQNRDWGVLYLGTKTQRDAHAGTAPALALVDAKGAPRADAAEVLAGLKGIIALDGSWEQAKAMWWRNPWLLKLPRLVLSPATASLYGSLRREPRQECLSTIESIAVALTELGEPQAGAILKPFEALLEKCRAAGLTGSGPRRKSRRGGHGRKGRWKRRSKRR